jgi:predicted nuclease with TOPRIM domain
VSGRAESTSLLPLRRSVLRHPLCDIGLAPDAAGRKLADRFREALRPRELVGALLRHAQHRPDFCHSHEFHMEGV